MRTPAAVHRPSTPDTAAEGSNKMPEETIPAKGDKDRTISESRAASGPEAEDRETGPGFYRGLQRLEMTAAAGRLLEELSGQRHGKNKKKRESWNKRLFQDGAARLSKS